METKKRKHDIELEKNDTTPVMSSSPTTLMSLRSGTVSIVEAVAVNLPDVFAAEIVPKLDWDSTLNLAQVSKSYRDAVWSVAGARSFHEKLECRRGDGSVASGWQLTHVLGGRVHELACGHCPSGVWDGREQDRSCMGWIHCLACRCLQRP